MTNVYKLYMLCIICAVLIFFFAAFIRFMLNSASKITGQNKISRSLREAVYLKINLETVLFLERREEKRSI